MLRVRLARVGKKKQPFFRIVVTDQRNKIQGAFVESLGWYDPRTKKINIKDDKVKEWMDKGAQPSNSLAILLLKEGVKLPKWVIIKKRKSKPKKEKVATKTEARPTVSTEGKKEDQKKLTEEIREIKEPQNNLNQTEFKEGNKEDSIKTKEESKDLDKKDSN
ncbi:MAG: 30S ribosomal protein S16 [Candidatus Aenigmarchaeota archaeon]|nr:30S ribosomal protein S16 [Candidatus Aenigmarchaeota archaeon]